MNEPNLIRNDHPHQVSMPDGAHLAVGKKAIAMEPSKPKVVADVDAIVSESSIDEQGVIAPEALPEQSEVALVPEDLPATHAEPGLLIERSEQDRFVALPEPVPEPLLQHRLPEPELASHAPVAAVFVAARAAAPALSDAMLTTLPMDFPARVVKLKIENDSVRKKLDALQFLTRS